MPILCCLFLNFLESIRLADDSYIPLLHNNAFWRFWNIMYLKILWKMEHLLFWSKWSIFLNIFKSIQKLKFFLNFFNVEKHLLRILDDIFFSSIFSISKFSKYPSNCLHRKQHGYMKKYFMKSILLLNISMGIPLACSKILKFPQIHFHNGILSITS